MLRTELAQEAWRAWVKDKPFQSEDTAKGFMEGFNFCLKGKVKVEGGDKGELIAANFSLQDKIAELKKACDETQALLDKQIEATYKVVEKLNKATEILKVVLNKWKEERWILQSEKEVKIIENVMKEAEAFLKEEQ